MGRRHPPPPRLPPPQLHPSSTRPQTIQLTCPSQSSPPLRPLPHPQRRRLPGALSPPLPRLRPDLVPSRPDLARDGNSSTGTRYPSGTRPDRYGYEDDFLPAGGTRTRPESRRIRDGYFFHPRVTRRVPDTLLPL
jgi:hypothetical protein